MSEEEVAEIDRVLGELRREIEEPLRRIERGIAAGEIDAEPVRRLAHNLRASLILYDRGR
jgi:hypothetical protein